MQCKANVALWQRYQDVGQNPQDALDRYHLQTVFIMHNYYVTYSAMCPECRGNEGTIVRSCSMMYELHAALDSSRRFQILCKH